MSTKDLIDGAVQHLRTGASVKAVYGDPIKTDGKIVIPVAKVAYGFGAGTAPHGKKTSNGKATSEGEGAGGGVAARPVGVVEITDDATRFVPVGGPKKLAIIALLGASFGAALGWFLGRRPPR